MSASEPTVLGFDLGTSGLKAAVVKASGELVDSDVVPLTLSLGPGGAAEQRPEDWWQALVTAATQLWARGRARPDDVVGIGVSSQWSGTVATSASGHPLRPALIWMDSRGAEETRRLCGGVPSFDGYGVRKAYRWIRLTGGAPSLSGKDPVGHIAWLKRYERRTYDDAALFLEPKDWVNLKLTGRAVASFDSITAHWVTDNRDINAVVYDDELLRTSELERSKLPDLIRPASMVGPLTADAAAALGVSAKVQVVSGAADMHMAAIGAGTVRDFQPHLCIGTSSWLLAHVPFKRSDLLHNMASLPAAIPGRYLFSNEQETAAGGLKLFMEGVLKAAGPDDYARAFADAEGVAPGCEGLIYLPWLHGERSPVDDRLVRGGFVGMGLHHGRGHFIRAIIEGVALNSRWLLTRVEENMGRNAEQVTVVGGGARSELWCQVQADVLGRPVRQVDQPQMANARGAAFQAHVALGHLSWDDVEARVPIRRTFMPQASNLERYTERFAQFLLEFRHRRAMGQRFGAGH